MGKIKTQCVFTDESGTYEIEVEGWSGTDINVGDKIVIQHKNGDKDPKIVKYAGHNCFNHFCANCCDDKNQILSIGDEYRIFGKLGKKLY